MKKWYIAYGSNMDEKQMAYRCPDSILAGSTTVSGYELLFKGSKTGAYATIEQKEGSKVPVLLWEISERDEKSLDRYEGFPDFYYKKTVEVAHKGKRIKAMVYIMHEERKLGRPSPRYYSVIAEAYQKFGWDKKILERALEISTENRGFQGAMIGGFMILK